MKISTYRHDTGRASFRCCSKQREKELKTLQ